MATRWQLGKYGGGPDTPSKICRDLADPNDRVGARFPKWCRLYVHHHSLLLWGDKWRNYTPDCGGAAYKTDARCWEQWGSRTFPSIDASWEKDPHDGFSGWWWPCSTDIDGSDYLGAFGGVGFEGPFALMYGESSSTYAGPGVPKRGISFQAWMKTFEFSGIVRDVLKIVLTIGTVDPVTDPYLSSWLLSYGSLSDGIDGGMIAGDQFYVFVSKTKVTSSFHFQTSNPSALTPYGLYTLVAGELTIDVSDQIDGEDLNVYLVPKEWVDEDWSGLENQITLIECEQHVPFSTWSCYLRKPDDAFPTIGAMRVIYD